MQIKQLGQKKLLIGCLAVILLIFGIIYLTFCGHKEEKIRGDYLETSAGFYLYDANRNPIKNSEQIELKESMEFYFQCVNACKQKLYYSIVLLVNDCYQDAEFLDINNENCVFGKSQIKAGQSEMIHIKFKLQDYEAQKKQGYIRFCFFYYPDILPGKKYNQVPVGIVDKIYKSSVYDGEVVSKTHNNLEPEYIEDKDEKTGKTVFISDEKVDTITKHNYLLKKNLSKKYFNIVANANTYYGILFVDGVPQLVNNDYLFEWEQQEGKRSLFDLELSLEKKKNIFMYMYEKGGNERESFVSKLYALT